MIQNFTTPQKAKRITAGILALLLLLSSAILTGYAETLTAGETVQGAFLEAELLAAMAAASDTDLLPVAIWLEPIDTELVEEIALKQTGLNKQVIRDMAEAGTDGQLTAEQVDAYISAERSVYAKLQTKANEAFLTSKVSVLSKDFDERDVFISAYSPMIVTTLCKEEIATIAANEQILSICSATRFAETRSKSSSGTTSSTQSSLPFLDAIAAVEADEVRDTGGTYTGSGIKIGQIEPGVPDETRDCFAGADITCRATSNHGSDEQHAAAVAGFLVSQDETVKGIIPDAQLFCTTMGAIPENADGSNDYSAFYENVEWLLSQGVHIINMSASVRVRNTSNGRYQDVSKWIDHIAINHSVHFVVAAGNYREPVLDDDPESYIKYVKPSSMAYNGITVGSANRRLNGLAEHSLYVEALSSGPNKPDLVAPGECTINIIDNDDADQHSGTSFAAPIVTGIAAQLMERRASLKVLQDVMKAVLTSSIKHLFLRYTNASAHATSFDQCGAGMVNAIAAMETISERNYSSGAFGSTASLNERKEYTFTIDDTSKKVRISLSWLKNNQFVGDCESGTWLEGNLANLDFWVNDPNGNVVATAMRHDGNNVEILEFTPTTTGEYTIIVRHTSSNANSTTYFAVAWFFA